MLKRRLQFTQKLKRSKIKQGKRKGGGKRRKWVHEKGAIFLERETRFSELTNM